MNPPQYTGSVAPLGREPQQQPAPRSDSHSELIRALLELLAGQWRIVVSVPIVVMVAVGAALLLMPRRYTSSASFIVEAAPNGGMVGAMAIISQLNPNLAGGDSPKFYVDLVQSRPVLENLLALVPGSGAAKRGARLFSTGSIHPATLRWSVSRAGCTRLPIASSRATTSAPALSRCQWRQTALSSPESSPTR
jgi:Uncharacterized protein involved in exopolysaccharide biosynthesis